MDSKSLSAVDKAALIILSLGQDTAAELMKNLSRQEVARLSKALHKVSDIPRKTQLAVVSEFQELLSASDKLLVDGEDFARQVISQAFGPDTSLLEELAGGGKRESLRSLLADTPANQLYDFISKEHPQTASVLLSELSPEQAAEVLAVYDIDDQTELLLRISQLKTVRPEVIDEVREVIRKELLSRRPDDHDVGGKQAAAAILSHLPQSAEGRVLSDLEELAPDLASELKGLMFTFEDLIRLSDKDLQLCLSKAPRDQLLTSLRLASAELKNKIFKNVSKRAAEQMQEELESIGKVKRSEVEQAQKSILELVKQLDLENTISIEAGSQEEEYV